MATGQDILRFAHKWMRQHPGSSPFKLRVALYEKFLGTTPSDALAREMHPLDPLWWIGSVGYFLVLLYPVVWCWELLVKPDREVMVGRIEAVLRMAEEEWYGMGKP